MLRRHEHGTETKQIRTGPGPRRVMLTTFDRDGQPVRQQEDPNDE